MIIKIIYISEYLFSVRLSVNLREAQYRGKQVLEASFVIIIIKLAQEDFNEEFSNQRVLAEDEDEHEHEQGVGDLGDQVHVIGFGYFYDRILNDYEAAIIINTEDDGRLVPGAVFQVRLMLSNIMQLLFLRVAILYILILISSLGHQYAYFFHAIYLLETVFPCQTQILTPQSIIHSIIIASVIAYSLSLILSFINIKYVTYDFPLLVLYFHGLIVRFPSSYPTVFHPSYQLYRSL